MSTVREWVRNRYVSSVWLCTVVVLLLTGTLSVPGGPALGASFQGIGTLPGDGVSVAYGISGDGQYVVGASDDQAIRWHDGTMTGLGMLGCPIPSWSQAFGVSQNGAHVVGGSCNDGFIWTQTTGMQALSTKVGQVGSWWANAVSSQGDIVVGINDAEDAFAWSSADGVISLGTLPGHDRAEGKGGHYSPPFPPWFPGLVTVVGTSANTTTGAFQAFKWDSSSQLMQGLGYLPGDARSGANAISRNASTIVGWSRTASGSSKPVRWVSGVIEEIPTGSIIGCEAKAVSGDGSVVVGSCGLGVAWIWDSLHGFRNMVTLLTKGFGLNLTDWTLSEATGVSDDGSRIVGYALYNPEGDTEGWIADVAIPNDAEGNAQSIGAGQTSGSLATATPDGSDSCGGTGSPDIWYRYTAPASGVLRLDTCGTNDIDGTDLSTDTILSLYSSDGSIEYGCNDDWFSSADPGRCSGVDTGFARDSYLERPLDAGESVLIRVARYPGSPALRVLANLELDTGPIIEGVWPNTPATGQWVSIFVFGSNFDTSPAGTQVALNGTPQSLVQVTTGEMLIVRTFFTSSLCGPVTVTTSEGTATSPIDLCWGAAPLEITGIWPSVVTEGQWVSVFVFGFGFDTSSGGTQVSINGIPQSLVQVVTPDMLVVRTLATNSMSGPVTVTTSAGTVTSTQSLIVKPAP
jgi:uncharacterized membrane protein